jgi:hypothetical protein
MGRKREHLIPFSISTPSNAAFSFAITSFFLFSRLSDPPGLTDLNLSLISQNSGDNLPYRPNRSLSTNCIVPLRGDK